MIGDVVTLPQGKHSKSRSVYGYQKTNTKQPQLKKSIFIVMFSVVILSVAFSNLTYVQGDNENNVFTINYIKKRKTLRLLPKLKIQKVK